MPASRGKSFVVHFVYYLLVATLVYLVWSYSPSDEHIVEPRRDNLQNIQEKELETFLDMNRFLTTLAAATIGGLGAIIFNRLKQELNYRQLLLAGLTCFSAGGSLYCGYISYHKVIWMLHSQFFDLNIEGIVVPERLQFLGLVLALFFFGDFALSGLISPQP